MSSPAELFDSGQVRLAELSLCNWGSFDGLHHARIDPQGTLITGDNGSGKSTLVDGLMALLVPAGRSTFNVAAAQGDSNDRSLMSYVRGSYGTGHDGAGTHTLNKRPGAVMSALRALYRADDGSEVTLLALLWTTQPGNALGDLKRLYLVARRNLALEDVLRDFGEMNARALKQGLRADASVSVFDDRFGEYQECWRRLLKIDNVNAPALLGRALGLKKIDDLTTLIRELVLEPSTVREEARKAVDEFADLVAIKDRLADARERRDALAPLPQVAANLERLHAVLAAHAAELAGLPPFIAGQAATLWRERAARLAEQLAGIAREIERFSTEIEAADAHVEQRHQGYLQAGGDRLESLERELARAREQLEAVSRSAAQYQQLARTLGLDDTLAHAQFDATQASARARLQNADAERDAARDALVQAGSRRLDLDARARELAEEAEALARRPDSNVDLRFQHLRDEMVTALDFDASDLVFIGELVDVADEHKAWQGAIERALGGLRQTLLVPDANYPLVTRWLNSRHTGLHVRVQVAGAARAGQASFLEDGFLRRLKWRQHPYRDWLKRHLAHVDLHCVDDTRTLDTTPHSMTREGLIHHAQGRFEKKDQSRVDDRRQWNLGFSNRERLALVRSDLEALATERAAAERAEREARELLDRSDQVSRSLQLLVELDWAQVNAPHWQREVNTISAALGAMRSAQADLDAARRMWDEAKAERERVRAEHQACIGRRGRIEEQHTRAEQAADKAAEAADAPLAEDTRTALHARVGELDDSALDALAEVERGHREALEGESASARREHSANTNRATGIMSAFRTRWEKHTTEWGSSAADLGDYLRHLDALESDGLPALVEEFVERLNRHTTQSLARIRSRLDGEREDIAERIDTINNVLARTEFRVGSHLKLVARAEHLPHVQDFNRRLARVLGAVNDADADARYALLEDVIGELARHSTPDGIRTVQGRTLLDPRYQLTFFAEERGTASGEVRDVLASSSGKSGGEKEAFAGTVVAAALAYVLTPDGHDRPVYCTVFLDEAFSNTAEAVSRRVLRVFAALHIHVNLITPYKNLDLARESARSLLIAERNAATHESRLSDVTWEEVDAQLEARRAAQVRTRAEALGVELAPLQ